jgi:hypothetical protein
MSAAEAITSKFYVRLASSSLKEALRLIWTGRHLEAQIGQCDTGIEIGDEARAPASLHERLPNARHAAASRVGHQSTTFIVLFIAFTRLIFRD